MNSLFIILGIAVFVLALSQGSSAAPCCAPPAQTKVPCGFLTASQVAVLAQNAGFRDGDLEIAVAVCLAESRGNPNAYNKEEQVGTSSGMGSYGLWQIYLQVHPEFRNVNLFDPKTNANAAFAVYSAAGNSFEPWATFDPRDCTTPKYLSFMNLAQGAIATLQNNSSPCLETDILKMMGTAWLGGLQGHTSDQLQGNNPAVTSREGCCAPAGGCCQ